MQQWSESIPLCVEGGPAPEQNPVRARFDSADGTAFITVLVRTAQSIKPTFMQVSET